MSEKGKSVLSENEFAQLKSMLSGAGELSQCFEQCAKVTSDPQIRDEFQKLAASAKNDINKINSMLGTVNGHE